MCVLRFYQAPFVFLVPIFIIGLLLGDLLSISWEWLLSCALLAGFLSLIIRPFRKLVTPIGAICILLFGAVLMGQTRSSSTKGIRGKIPRIAIVKEAEKSDKIWKKVIIEVKRCKVKGKWKEGTEQVLIYSQYQFREGDILMFNNSLANIKNAGNPGEFDAKSYWNSKNIYAMGFLGNEDFTLLDYENPNKVDLFFRGTREYLLTTLDNALPNKEASIASALLLGNKSKLSNETRESFGNAGAMHVLAISGLHVGIIMYLLFFVLKSFSRWITRNLAIAITILFLWLFAGVTGWSPSVVRATLMFSLLLIGQQTGRSPSPMNSLFFSAFLMLMYDPLVLYDIGFQLSYGAMFGIFLFFNKVKDLIRPRSKILSKAWEGTALGISAQLFTIPLVLYHFHQFPNYFWLTNLGIMLLAGLILAIGMIFFVVHGIPFLNAFVALLLGWALYTLILFIDWVDALPWGLATGFELHPAEIVLFISLMFTLLITFQNKGYRWVSIGIMLIMVGGWQWSRFEATNKSELVVFNSNSPVIACKSGNAIQAFYTGDRKRAERLLDAYVKVNPGVVQLDTLQNSVTIEMGKRHIDLVSSRNGIMIHSEGKKTFVRTRYHQINEPVDQIVNMPYLQEQKMYWNLSKGAYRLRL